jgi:hypothetical protein
MFKIFTQRDEGSWGDSVDIGNEPGAHLEAYRDFVGYYCSLLYLRVSDVFLLAPAPKMHTHSLFDLEHVEDWVKHASYLVFEALVYSTLNKRCKQEDEVIDLSMFDYSFSPLSTPFLYISMKYSSNLTPSYA